MIEEHKIQVRFKCVECNCGWNFNFYGVDLFEDVRKEIRSHVDDFMKTGDYIRLAPGSTIERFKLRSACTEEEINGNEQWQ